MAIRSFKSFNVYVWIPPAWSPIYKIEIEKASDGTKYDITDIIYDGSYTDGITETIGNFGFTMDNSNEDYTTTFSLGDKINIYLDYSDTATTKRFVGYLEKISKRMEKLVLTGRSLGVKLLGINVTKSYTNTETGAILKDLIDNYIPEFTYTNVNTSTSYLTVNWNQKPFWECVQELCAKATFDAYVDASGDFHYFASGTVNNTTEAIVHDSNLIDVGDFAPDLSVIKNKIKINGAKIEEQPVIWTAKDDDSIDLYGLKEEIISDNSINTIEQAQIRAAFELSSKKEPPIVGEVTSLGLPTLLPGERVRISDPFSDLQPAYYTIQKFTHKFSNDEPFQTDLTIYKEINTIPKLLKKRIKYEADTIDTTNPYEMNYSWLFDYNATSGSHTNTQITDGRLQATSSSGTWISESLILSNNVISCEMRVKGDQLIGTLYYVSPDNGISWQSISLNTLKTLSPPGQNLKIKIEFNSASTQIDSLILLYKT